MWSTSAETGQGSGKGMYLRERDICICVLLWFLCGTGQGTSSWSERAVREGCWVRVVSGGRGDSSELWEHLNNPLSPLSLPLSSRPAIMCQ